DHDILRAGRTIPLRMARAARVTRAFAGAGHVWLCGGTPCAADAADGLATLVVCSVLWSGDGSRHGGFFRGMGAGLWARATRAHPGGGPDAHSFCLRAGTPAFCAMPRAFRFVFAVILRDRAGGFALWPGRVVDQHQATSVHHRPPMS